MPKAACAKVTVLVVVVAGAETVAVPVKDVLIE